MASRLYGKTPLGVMNALGKHIHLHFSLMFTCCVGENGPFCEVKKIDTNYFYQNFKIKSCQEVFQRGYLEDGQFSCATTKKRHIARMCPWYLLIISVNVLLTGT